MADNLKPCPFCGGKAKINYLPPFVHPKTGRKGIERRQVYCDNCGVVTAGMVSEEAAIEAWNRRAEDGKTDSKKS